MNLRKYLGIFLSLVLSSIAMVFSLPVLFAKTFTWFSGMAMCWAEKQHIYPSSYALMGVKLEDLLCVRCGKRISGEDKTKLADEILGLNLALEDLNRGIAAEKLIEETKNKNQID